MAKALWRGYIALGQIGVPIVLYAATQPSGPRFVQLHATDLSPVTRELKCKKDGRPLTTDELVRAVEYEPGKYIALADSELERAAPDVLKTLTIRQFSSADAVPPMYYEKPYYVVPEKGGETAYSLFREVFSKTASMAIVSYVLYNHAHTGALRQEGDMLMLLQLRFPSELVPRTDIETPPLAKPTPKEIDLMAQVVERYSSPVYMQDYHDEYTERILQLVERKAKGLPEPRKRRAGPHATPEAELAATLEQTLANGPKGLGQGTV